jgi:hypothetical protein
MCDCHMFPAYSSKLAPASFPFPHQFAPFCLRCIESACFHLSNDTLSDLWDKAGTEEEYVQFYQHIYTAKEITRIVAQRTRIQQAEITENLSRALEPLMEQQGMERKVDCETCSGEGLFEGVTRCWICAFQWQSRREQEEEQRERDEKKKKGKGKGKGKGKEKGKGKKGKG